MSIADYFERKSSAKDKLEVEIQRRPLLAYPDVGSSLRTTLVHPKTGRVIPASQYELYDALCQIPRGRVTTYAALALHLTGSVHGARSIGHRMSGNLNCFAPSVPCHRVIKSDGGIGGFGSETALDSAQVLEKLGLLRSEGVYFDAKARLVDRSRLWKDFQR